jgi:hypothetical protein
MESPPSSESHDQVTSGDLLKWKLHDDEGEGSGDSSSLTSRRREESMDDGTIEPLTSLCLRIQPPRNNTLSQTGYKRP